jgi:hypothetical protein
VLLYDEIQGRYGMVFDKCLEVFSAREKALGAEHPDILTSVNNLAGVLRAQGKYKEAKEININSILFVFDIRNDGGAFSSILKSMWLIGNGTCGMLGALSIGPKPGCAHADNIPSGCDDFPSLSNFSSYMAMTVMYSRPR